MTPRRPSRRSLAAIFAAPLTIGVLSVGALIAALTGDGWRDMLSWVGLAVPILTVAWAMRARRIPMTDAPLNRRDRGHAQ